MPLIALRASASEHRFNDSTIDGFFMMKQSWHQAASKSERPPHGQPRHPHIVFASTPSWRISDEISTAGFLDVFFHQWARSPDSTARSPALCTIGTAQLERYSVIWPDTI